jgi:hypothetical protein
MAVTALETRVKIPTVHLMSDFALNMTDFSLTDEEAQMAREPAPGIGRISAIKSINARKEI